MSKTINLALALLLLSGCAEFITTSGGGSGGSSSESSAQPAIRTVPLNASQSERLKNIMVPLLRAANKPRTANQVRIGLIDDADVNAANAGGGEYYVTTGLLKKANDEQLRGVLAHEIAHDDLGHVAKAQVLGAGLNIGMIVLEQVFPGSSALTPIAGKLIASSYSRQEEYAADRHGMALLQRAGYPPQTMERTLQWLLSMGSSGGGGFLSSHPATEDRIAELRK